MRFVTVLFLLVISSSAVWGKDANWQFLKKWNGKYPTKEKTKENFFEISLVNENIRELLSKKDFKHLTKELEVETPIETVGEYLLVMVCLSHCCPCDNAIVIIGLESKAIHIGFYEGYQNKSATSWFSNKGEYSELPKEILESFAAMHIPK